MKKLFVLPLLLLGLHLPASATLLVSESFNYAVSDGSTMGGVATNATGLGGNYTLTTGTLSGTSASATYLSSGLTFGANYTASASTGAVRFSTTSASDGNGGSAILAAVLTASTTGTLWSSYLVTFSSRINNPSASATSRLSDSATAGTAAYFVAAADSNTVQDRPAVTYETGTQANSSFTTSLNTTYIIISKYDNVGTALGTGTANLWLFNLAGYNNWVAGGSVEANLGSFASGSATDTASTGTFNFNNTRFIQFSMFAGSNAILGTYTATYDELRYATTLGEVLTVPEPGAAGLLVLGAGGFALFRRRRL